jgi:hypothetical protein
MCCNITIREFPVFVMDDTVDNFGAAQYPLKYWNFTLNGKLSNLMCEMNKAVPLILHSFHPKGKMLCCNGHLNSTVLQLQQKTGILKVWSWDMEECGHTKQFNVYNQTVTASMISGTITMVWCLFSLWMQMVSRYSLAVKTLNKKLWAANR